MESKAKQHKEIPDKNERNGKRQGMPTRKCGMLVIVVGRCCCYLGTEQADWTAGRISLIENEATFETLWKSQNH